MDLYPFWPLLRQENNLSLISAKPDFKYRLGIAPNADSTWPKPTMVDDDGPNARPDDRNTRYRTMTKAPKSIEIVVVTSSIVSVLSSNVVVSSFRYIFSIIKYRCSIIKQHASINFRCTIICVVSSSNVEVSFIVVK